MNLHANSDLCAHGNFVVMYSDVQRLFNLFKCLVIKLSTVVNLVSHDST